MSSNAISFIAWAAFMLIALAAIIAAARKSKGIQEEVEDVASKALPEIGEIAEKKHVARFGRAPTDAPGNTDSWYPEAKKKVAKHA